MSDTLILYLLTRLDGLKSAFDFAVFVSGFGVLLFVVSAIVCFGPGADDKDLDRARAGLPRLIKVALTALVSVSVLNIATPTKNDVLFIIGGSALLDMAKSDRAKSIGDKTLSAVETWLDQNLPKEPGQ